MGGYLPGAIYVLAGLTEGKYPDEDKQAYYVLITPAIDTRGLGLSIDYFIDKAKQARSLLAAHLEKVLPKLKEIQLNLNDEARVKEIIGQALKDDISTNDRSDTINKIFTTLKELQFLEQNVICKIKELDSSTPNKDIFEELADLISRTGDFHAKILFPYNVVNENHWLTGEIKIHRVGKSYQIDLTAHDPFGGGEIAEESRPILFDTISKRIKRYDVAAKLNFQFYKSAYNQRQHTEDGDSCGAIVVEDMFARVMGNDLMRPRPYPDGASEIRQQHINIVHSNLLENDATRIDFLKRNSIEANERSLVDYNDGKTKKKKRIPSVNILSPIAAAPFSTGILLLVNDFNSVDVLLQKFSSVKENLKKRYLSSEWNQIPLLRNGSKGKIPSLNLDAYIDVNLVKQQPKIDGTRIKDTPIELAELFNRNQNVLLEGEMGSGKSLLARLIPHLWAKGKIFKDFDYIFCLDLRACVKKAAELANTPYRITSCSKLLQVMCTDAPIDHSDLMQVVLRNKKVLIVADYYDDVASIDSNTVDLLLDQNDYYCLIGARPGISNKLKKYVNMTVENRGISAASIPIYIKKYFKSLSNKKQGEDLYNWLKQKPALLEICKTPIYLEMLCGLWINHSEKIKSSQDLSKTELHKIFIEHLLEEHMIQNNHGTSQLRGLPTSHLPEVVLSRIFLERVAYLYFLNPDNKQHISYELIQKARLAIENDILQGNITAYLPQEKGIAGQLLSDLQELVKNERRLDRDPSNKTLYERLTSSGILNLEFKGKTEEENIYSFPRASFAEYFLASYICNYINDRKPIEIYKYDPTWLLVWKMLANLLKSDPDKLKIFFETLLAPPRDIYGRYELEMLIQCLEMCDWLIPDEYIKPVVNYFRAWVKGAVMQGDPDIPITPYFASKINLEELLLSMYRDADAKKKGFHLFDNPQKERDKKNLHVKFAVVKMLSQMPTLSDAGVELLFESWNSQNGLIYSFSESAIKRLVNHDVRVLAKVLNKQGPGMVRPSPLAGWSSCHGKEAWQEILAGIKDPSDEVINYLAQKINEIDWQSGLYILNIFRGVKHPSKHLIELVVDMVKELVKIIPGNSMIIRRVGREQQLIYLAAYHTILKWGSKRILEQLNFSEIQELIVLIFKIAYNDRFAFETGDLPEFINGIYRKKKNKFFKLLLGLSDHDDKNVQCSALCALRALKKPNIETLKFLLNKFNTSKGKIRDGAFEALLSVAKYLAKHDIAGLRDFLKSQLSSDGLNPKVVLLLLAKISVPTLELADTLITIASESKGIDNFHVRNEAEEMIGKLRDLDLDTTRALIKNYSNTKLSENIRLEILKAMGYSNHCEDQVIGALFSKLLDEKYKACTNKKVSTYSTSSMEQELVEIIRVINTRIYSPNGIQILINYTKTSQPLLIRKVALTALGLQSSPSVEVIEALLQSCNDQDLEIQKIALEAIGNDYLARRKYSEIDNLNNLCWVPSKEALKKLRRSTRVSVSRLIRIAALNGLVRMRTVDHKTLKVIFDCYMAGDTNEISTIAGDILECLTQDQLSADERCIEKLMLEKYSIAAPALKAKILYILGMLPNSSVEVIKFLLRECGNAQKELRYRAHAALLQQLTKRKHKFLWQMSDEPYVEEILSGGRSLDNEKPLSSIANFEQATLFMILDACGDPNPEISRIASSIINNFSSYEGIDVNMLQSWINGRNDGSRIAALQMLHRAQESSAQPVDKLIQIAFNESENKEIRLSALKLLSKQPLLNEKQAEAIINYLTKKDKNKDEEIFYAAFKALSLQTLLTHYPVENSKLNDMYRRRWLMAKLLENPPAILERPDGSLILYDNNTTYKIRSKYLKAIKEDLKKIRMVPDEHVTLTFDTSGLQAAASNSADSRNGKCYVM